MPDLTIKSVPDTISKAKLDEAMKTLGFEPDNLRKLTIDRGNRVAEAELFVEHADGGKFSDPTRGTMLFEVTVRLET